jgi:hypothetical protein
LDRRLQTSTFQARHRQVIHPHLYDFDTSRADNRKRKLGFIFPVHTAVVVKVLCILFAFGLFTGPACAREAIEDQRIEFLIGEIAGMHDAVFIRNGREYDAQRAADHMRLKLRYAGAKAQTAEDFIVCCGTGSSVSGQPYMIKFTDGRIVPSADFLRAKLTEFPALRK